MENSSSIGRLVPKIWHGLIWRHFVSFTLLSVLSGCLMIPAGHRVETKESHQNESVPISAADIKFKIGYDGKLIVMGLPGTGTIREGSKAEIPKKEITTTKFDDYVIVGLVPGLCANWCVGESMKSNYKEDAISGVFEIALLNTITCGLPTVLGWFGEFRADWSPPKERSKRETTALSVIGWAKTSRHSEEKSTPVVSNDVVCAVVSLPEIGLAKSIYPDKDGWYRVKLAPFKQSIDRPWALHISLADSKAEVKTFVKVLNSEVLK